MEGGSGEVEIFMTFQDRAYEAGGWADDVGCCVDDGDLETCVRFWEIKGRVLFSFDFGHICYSHRCAVSSLNNKTRSKI